MSSFVLAFVCAVLTVGEGSFYASLVDKDFRVLAGVLRLSTKYDARHLRRKSIEWITRIFPSTLLSSSLKSSPTPNSNADCPAGISISLTPMPSPPPSPSRGKDAKLHLALRRELDSRAFERSPALEDARDYVVDMLTAEKMGRRVR